MGKNIFFDTCVYHQPGIDLLTKVVPTDNILFASEMVGAVKGNDPGPASASTTPSATSTRRRSSDAEKQKIFEDNSYKVYPRLKAQLRKQAA